MFNAMFHYEFLRNAMMASILASIVCGIIGVIIIEKKLVMMSGGIAHTAYGGVGLGYFLGIQPLVGAVLFAIGASFGIGYVRKRGGVHSDVIIALFWSLGMALGILFVAFMPGYPPDMTSYLFGNILSITNEELLMIMLLSCVVVLWIVPFFHDWKVFLFDAEFAQMIGKNTALFEYSLLVLIAMTVVVLIYVAGIILMIALFVAPAATAGLLSKNLRNRMIFAVLFGIVFCLVGLWISYTYNLPSGATIIIFSVLCYTMVFFCQKVWKKINTMR